MQRQIILDTETTGLDPKLGHRIIEVGCLEMVNRRITGNNFHAYINPERTIERGAEEVHGITNDFVKDKPVFAAIAESLLDFIKGAELIIHNAPFDLGFLDTEFKLVNKKFKRVTDFCGVIDTLQLARQKHPGQHNNLDALCKRYKVDNSNRDLHGALLDAQLLAQVYLAMTGGQTQLFDSFEEAAVNVATGAPRIKRVSKKRDSLPVIKASEAELSAHEKYLAMLVREPRQ